MSLRRPAAHLRRPPAWRRSGYESNWESLMAEEGEVAGVCRPPLAPRPQSAIEGGQLDGWLEHLQRMQRDLLGIQDQVPAPAGPGWKQSGSRESLHGGGASPPERKGSWEKARITQVASREQTRLSCIAPVKIGWLPIQRRVTVAAGSKQGQFLDSSSGQVKHLKQDLRTVLQEGPSHSGIYFFIFCGA